MNTKTGTVLKVNDPRAWGGTGAFPNTPSQEQVDAHLANLQRKGVYLTRTVPVLVGGRVSWEPKKGWKP